MPYTAQQYRAAGESISQRYLGGTPLDKQSVMIFHAALEEVKWKVEDAYASSRLAALRNLLADISNSRYSLSPTQGSGLLFETLFRPLDDRDQNELINRLLDNRID